MIIYCARLGIFPGLAEEIQRAGHWLGDTYNSTFIAMSIYGLRPITSKVEKLINITSAVS